MFERAHHNRIFRALHLLNAPLLQATSTYFAGGTAIVLLCKEYRESVDMDFLCADPLGYRQLRHVVTDRNLGSILTQPVDVINFSADDYGIRCFLMIDEQPIKFEIVKEDRITLSGSTENSFPVPVLSRADMYTEKLLANADRGLDTSTLSRDMIDLAMMIMQWGDIPAEALEKATAARGYGSAITRSFNAAWCLMNQRDQAHLRKSLDRMSMDEELCLRILETLKSSQLHESNPAPENR